MNRLDHFLVVSRIACTGLAVASFVISPSPTSDQPVSAVLLCVKAYTFILLVWVLAAMAVHLCSVRQLIWPNEHFSYCMVAFQWIFTGTSVVTASAGLGVITGTYFLHNCVGSFRPICWKYELSLGLAFLLAVLNIVVSMLMNWARLTNGPHVLAN